MHFVFIQQKFINWTGSQWDMLHHMSNLLYVLQGDIAIVLHENVLYFKVMYYFTE